MGQTWSCSILPPTIKFTVHGRPELPNQKRSHWSARARNSREWRKAVILAARVELGPPPYPMFDKATVTFDCFRSREPDHDNLVASIKPLLDGLQPAKNIRRPNGVPIHVNGCGIIATDEPSCIGSPIVRWHKCKRSACRVEITVDMELEGNPE